MLGFYSKNSKDYNTTVLAKEPSSDVCSTKSRVLFLYTEGWFHNRVQVIGDRFPVRGCQSLGSERHFA